MSDDATGAVFRDRQILDALSRTKGLDRNLLVLALGISEGEEGVPFLKRLLHNPGPDERDLAGLALTPLAARCGAEVTPDLIEDLVRTGHIGSMRLIATYADERAGKEVLAWLRKKLRGRTPVSANADPDDIPLSITYLASHPECERFLVAAGQRLLAKWRDLDRDEKRWLTKHWPGLTKAPAGDGSAEIPLPGDLDVERMRNWLAGVDYGEVKAEHIRPLL